MRSTDYEFQAYDEEGRGPFISFECMADINAAKRRAGASAKRINGPVDLAYSGDEPWEERYITTACPSEYHASGYRFESLT